MAPEQQQFCLRWNNYQTNLTQVFEQLLQSEKFVDVTLACEGNSIRAHRMVLSSCSTYFQTVLSESPCSHPVIILQGVKWTELKAIVEFMYKGEVNISQDQLSSLLRVGESLKIRGLAEVGGDDSEAVITSPSVSPRVSSQFWSEEAPRKRRRLSEDRSCSRSRTPSPRVHTPSSSAEILETSIDLPSNLSRGSSVSNPSTSLPSPSPVASLASSLSSLAHLQGPMPPPGPPLPPHLAHLPPLSPLSPLLNMHPMPRHHPQEDFEIRPGIAEMIREEERAKLLESTHHWISNPMADYEYSVFSNLNGHTRSTHLQNGFSLEPRYNRKFPADWPRNDDFYQNLSAGKFKGNCKWSQDDLASALIMVKNGTPIKPAAEKFNIPVMTLWRRTRALGLVSSKVQCGFRYSSPKNSNNQRTTAYPSTPSVTEGGTKDNKSAMPSSFAFCKERSPLIENNHGETSVDKHYSGDTKENIKLANHKENSPNKRSVINDSVVTSLDSSERIPNSATNNALSNQKEILTLLSSFSKC